MGYSAKSLKNFFPFNRPIYRLVSLYIAVFIRILIIKIHQIECHSTVHSSFNCNADTLAFLEENHQFLNDVASLL